MQKDILSMILCPSCYSNKLSLRIFREETDAIVRDGVIVCALCRNWYPIEDSLLELLSNGLQYYADRMRFYHKYIRKMHDLHKDIRRFELRAMQQHKQQTHFDWYSNNTKQTYDTYAKTRFWIGVDTMVFSRWSEDMKKNEWFLDVGCGQGRSTFNFMDKPLRIVGFDISKALIRQAIQKYKQKNYKAKATFMVADATKFPFQDTIFQYVMTYGVLHHLNNPMIACKEIVRVLRTSGTYFGLENNKTPFRLAFEILQKIMPLWHEIAGPKPLMDEQDYINWFSGTSMQLKIHTSVYIPPHIINVLPREQVVPMLRATDALASSFSSLRKWGGLIVVTGTKKM